MPAEPLPKSKEELLEEVDVLAASLTDGLEPGFSRPSGPPSEVTIMLEHIPKTKDELLQEMDVLAASLTAGLDASPGEDRAEGDLEAEALLPASTSSPPSEATIFLEHVPKSQDELHAEMNVLAASLTAGLADLPSKSQVEDDAAEVATLAPEQEEMQEMQALVATEPSPPAEEARDTPRSGASGHTSAGTSELDLATELVHAACQAQDTPQEALSVVVSQATAMDAPEMVVSLQESPEVRPPSAGQTSAGTPELELAKELVHTACQAGDTPQEALSVVVSQATESVDAARIRPEEVLAARPLDAGTFPASSVDEATIPAEPLPKSKEELLEEVDVLAVSLTDGLEPGFSRPSGPPSEVTIMLEHIPKTKDELLQEMDVLAASLTAGLDASPGEDRAEGDPEAEAPVPERSSGPPSEATVLLEHIPKTKEELLQEMDVLAASLTAGLDASSGEDRADGDPEAEALLPASTSSPASEATIFLEQVPKSQDELHAEMNVLAASLTAGLADLPSKSHVEDDAAEVATLAPEQEEMQEMHALVATEPSPPAEEARDTPRSGASGQTSARTSELDLATELVHAACYAGDSPQEAVSVVVSQASAAADATEMMASLQEKLDARRPSAGQSSTGSAELDLAKEALSVVVSQASAAVDAAVMVSALKERLGVRPLSAGTEGSFPASSLGEDLQAAVPLPITSHPASEASVLVEPPRSQELLAMMDNLAQSLMDGLQVVEDVKQAQPGSSETQPSAKDVAEQDRPTSGGFDRSVASVLASAACSEAAEAVMQAAYEEVLPCLQLEADRRPSRMDAVESVGSGSEEAGKLGAAAAAKLLLEAQPGSSETQPSAKDVAEQDRPTSGGFDRDVASVLASAACSEAAEAVMQAAYEEVLPCHQLEADRRPSRLDAVESIGSMGSEDSARVGQAAAAKLLSEVADAAPSSEVPPAAPKQVKEDVDAAAMVQSLKERLKMRPPSAGLTSVGTAELDLAAELVHAACTAAETPPEASSVAMSQATADDDATAALQSVQEGLQGRPPSAGTRSFPASSLVEAALPVPSTTGPASEERVQLRPPSAGTGSHPLSSMGEAADAQVVADVLEAAMPLPSMTGPASEATIIIEPTADADQSVQERVQLRPPSAGTGSHPLSSMGEAADAQVVADVLEAAMPLPSMTGPASEVEQGSSETEPRGEDARHRDRPASPGLEPGVVSVIASATCSEAAEAAVRAAYEEVLRPSLELEPGRRPSGFGLPESIASVGSEEAARLGAAAAADLLDEATDLAPSGAASVRTASSWEERITTEATGDLLPDTHDHARLVEFLRDLQRRPLEWPEAQFHFTVTSATQESRHVEAPEPKAKHAEPEEDFAEPELVESTRKAPQKPKAEAEEEDGSCRTKTAERQEEMRHEAQPEVVEEEVPKPEMAEELIRSACRAGEALHEASVVVSQATGDAGVAAMTRSLQDKLDAPPHSTGHTSAGTSEMDLATELVHAAACHAGQTPQEASLLVMSQATSAVDVAVIGSMQDLLESAAEAQAPLNVPKTREAMEEVIKQAPCVEEDLVEPEAEAAEAKSAAEVEEDIRVLGDALVKHAEAKAEADLKAAEEGAIQAMPRVSYL
ncbi:arsB [Symbiodinium sp. CCMP2456]|nr:arsB [Symbiodinium sp. CCMP2456]